MKISPEYVDQTKNRVALKVVASFATLVSGAVLWHHVEHSAANEQFAEYAKPNLVKDAKPGSLPKDAIIETVPNNVHTPIEFVKGLAIKPEDKPLVTMIVEKELGGAGSLHAGDQVAVPAEDYLPPKG